MNRTVLRTVLIIGSAGALGMLGACDGETQGNQPQRGQIVRMEGPERTEDAGGKAEEEQASNQPDTLRTVEDAETRYESNKPRDLQGMEQAAAPLRYATTSIRLRGHAQDTMDAAQATRALTAFKAMEDRLPRTIKELREWGDDNGWPVPEPANDGVYVLNKSKSKLIIVDPSTLD